MLQEALCWSRPLPAGSKTAASNLSHPKPAPLLGCLWARGSSHRGWWHQCGFGWGVAPYSRRVHPRGTAATGDSRRGSDTPRDGRWGKACRRKTWRSPTGWGKLLTSKELQEKTSEQNAAEEIAKKRRMEIVTQVTPTVLPVAKCLCVWLFSSPQYPNQWSKFVLTGNKLGKNSLSQGCFAHDTLLDKQNTAIYPGFCKERKH